MHTRSERTGWRVGLVAWIACALPALAVDYYVNDVSRTGDVALPGCPSMTSGLDVPACGTCLQPCATPQYLYDTQPLKPGDTVHLNTGVYRPIGVDAVLKLGDPSKAGEPERWITFTGPLDAQGRSRRDAVGRPLAVIDGRASARAGVVVQVDGIRLRALGLTNFRGDEFVLCGSAVRILPDVPVTSFLFADLDIFELQGACSNAIDIDANSVECKQCQIVDSRFTRSPDSSEALWIVGQHGVEIASNTIQGWGRRRSDAAIRIRSVKLGSIHHNILRDNAGPAIVLEDSDNVVVAQNTVRHNALSTTTGVGATRPAEMVVFRGVGLQMVNNVIAPIRGRAALAFASADGDSDYNGYVMQPGAWLVDDIDTGLRYDDLEAWQAVYGDDRNSLVVDDARFASDDDLHLRSTAGRFVAGAGWVMDADSSPFLDRAQPFAGFSYEPMPNGARANLGAYGDTVEASLSPVRLTAASGEAQQGPVRVQLPQPLVVQASVGADVTPAALEGIPLHFEIVQGEGEFAELPAATDASGRAEVRFTPTTEGEVVVEVSVTGAPGIEPARFTLEGTAAILEPEPGPATRPDYRVSCGCTQGGGIAPLAALLLLFGWARSRGVRRG